MHLTTRPTQPRAAWQLEQQGVDPFLAQLFAARGVQSAEELDDKLAALLPPDGLKGIAAAVAHLAQAMADNKRLCVVADYDCDGATACAVAVRGLRLLGAQHVDYLVPNRVVDGYGLTASIAERVKAAGHDVLITVDNGIASVQGVARAKELGLTVIVTDHHLPGDSTPDADALVNPNQHGCTFASKNLAGVGVMFYVLLALRAHLRGHGKWPAQAQPRLDTLLPLVALGTVADVVKLDANNRRLVSQGLKRIRQNHMPAGMAALLAVAGRACAKVSSQDLGFVLGPRINAAGRLSDMRLGIECLLTDAPERAAELAQQLDHINRERRDVEGQMRDQALEIVEGLWDAEAPAPAALTVFDPDFHEGVVGIVAARLKDRLHRPTFVFAPSGAPGKEHELKGSGRSIAGFHLRDALDCMSKQNPDLILRFGGHAMAAGCTIDIDQIDAFEAAFEAVASAWLDPATLTQTLQTDGPLPALLRRPETVALLEAQVWGQGFAAPVFAQELQVVSQRLVGEKHLSLKLRHEGEAVDGIWFGRTEPVASQAVLAFRLQADEWQGQKRLQLVIEGMAS
jgi:single-stranded-DNA-specific exonuclease